MAIVVFQSTGAHDIIREYILSTGTACCTTILALNETLFDYRLTGMACCTTIVTLIETLFSYHENDRMRAIFGSGKKGQEKGEIVVLCLPDFVWKAARACVHWAVCNISFAEGSVPGIVIRPRRTPMMGSELDHVFG